MIELPMSKETHGSFAVRGKTLVFVSESGLVVDVATFEATVSAIRTAEAHNTFLAGVGTGHHKLPE